MSATQAMLLLVSLYVSAVYAGQVPAILFRIPGAEEAVATTLDGYPMAQKGQAGKALGYGLSSSIIGSIFGAIVLILLAPLLASVALKFGPPEYFALGVLGLTAVSGLCGKSMIKAGISVLLGLFFAAIGIDPMSGMPRFTFGTRVLLGGIPFIPALLGLFAVAEVFKQVTSQNTDMAKTTGLQEQIRLKVELPSLRELKNMFWVILRSCLIGSWIGILPGVGATTAAIMGYSWAVKLSKEPEKFGTGIPEGIASCEAANNAAVGGALVPLLSLGIPGSGTTAIMLGAFLIHGLRPGPLFLAQQQELAYSIFAGLLVSSILLLPIALQMIKPFLRIFSVPYPVLAAGILGFCAAGARGMGDLYGILLMFAFGVIGYILEKYEFPVAPVVLGLVLGPIVETSFRRALILGSSNPLFFMLSRPITVSLLLLAVLLIVGPIYFKKKRAHTENVN
jgi:putative tricarboxylic transport membrane protein